MSKVLTQMVIAHRKEALDSPLRRALLREKKKVGEIPTSPIAWQKPL